MNGGTIVDAAMIDAPGSTKNTEKKRAPEMHSARKGNQWRFGMKCHAGVDAGTGYVHTIEVTAPHDVSSLIPIKAGFFQRFLKRPASIYNRPVIKGSVRRGPFQPGGQGGENRLQMPAACDILNLYGYVQSARPCGAGISQKKGSILP